MITAILLKNSPILLNTLSQPNVYTRATTGPSHNNRQMTVILIARVPDGRTWSGICSENARSIAAGLSFSPLASPCPKDPLKALKPVACPTKPMNAAAKMIRGNGA